MAKAMYLALTAEDNDRNQRVARLLVFAELAAEKRFAKKILVPLVWDKHPIAAVLFERSTT